jgi:hypothetical protein
MTLLGGEIQVKGKRPATPLNRSMQGEARWMSAAKRDKNGVTKMDEECMLIF